MMRGKLVCLFALLLAVVPVFAGWVNDEVEREIDATSSIVTVTVDISASGSGAYSFILPAAVGSKVAAISAEDGDGKALSVKEASGDADYSKWSIAVGNGDDQSFSVTYIVTHALQAVPAEIKQAESQLVVLTGNAYFTSPYATTSQKTTVRLASTDIKDYSEVEPTSASGDSVVYGSYSDVAPLASAPLRVHSENNSPFATVHTALREVEVSHWGAVSVEEHYELLHTGAKLTGGFSRFDYQMQRQDGNGPSFRGLTAVLPSAAHSIYYRDIIGNISTSEVTPSADGLQLKLDARFPLFGGWKTEFYTGYTLPASEVLSASSGRYTLTVDFGLPVDGIVTDDLTVKVILPEGATDVKVDTPTSHVSVEHGKRFTYLDTPMNGRPVLTLKKSNVVAENNGPLVVTYSFTGILVWREPLLLTAFFFALFSVAIVVRRVGAAMAGKSKAE
eukprot:PLAT9879.1.p1 GENE.PLAT9879.1~~PLAT9879.1.p1  ORF type:complete len:448 (+),score=261.76 PLAT9879.1:15-1358(+)